MIELWIKAARKTGNPVPRPSYRADVNYSGKFLMRVPKRLHSELAHAAKAQSAAAPAEKTRGRRRSGLLVCARSRQTH